MTLALIARKTLSAFALASVLALTVAACGDDDGDTTGDATTTTDVTSASTTAVGATADDPGLGEAEPDAPLTASFRGVSETDILIGVGYVTMAQVFARTGDPITGSIPG